MSFSRSFGPVPSSALVETIEAMKTPQRADDSASADAIADGHESQLSMVAAGAAELHRTHPNAIVAGSAYGHANTDGSGSFGMSYSLS